MPKKVAVIGSGIAGLSAGWILGQNSDMEVWMFEREESLGMDAHSVDVLRVNGDKGRVDAPLRVFSRSYYPHLTSLYEHVGIAFTNTDYSFSVSHFQEATCVYRYMNFLWRNFAIPFPYLHPSFWSLILEFIKFFWNAPRVVASGKLSGKTLGEYLVEEGYSDKFINQLLVPMLSVVCTCSCDAVKRYPADLAINYLAQGSELFQGKFKVRDGVNNVVQRLAAPVKHVLLGVTVTAVERSDGANRCRLWYTDTNGITVVEHFDDIVIATQAMHALELLCPNATSSDRFALGAFEHEESFVTVHRDPSLMPVDRNLWSPLNLILSNEKKAPMCSVWMQTVDRSLPHDLFETWNPHVMPAPEKTISVSKFYRPVMTLKSRKCLEELDRINGDGNVWFCGAYALYAMPLLESGVRSAIHVASRMGTTVPWGSNEKKLICDEGFSLPAVAVRLAFMVSLVTGLKRLT